MLSIHLTCGVGHSLDKWLKDSWDTIVNDIDVMMVIAVLISLHCFSRPELYPNMAYPVSPLVYQHLQQHPAPNKL